MALKKAKTINGHASEYWRIVQINTNFDRLDVVTTVALYKDKATRDADSNTVMYQFHVCLGSEFTTRKPTDALETLRNITLKEAYNALKKLAGDEAVKLVEKNLDLAYLSDAVDV